MALICATNRNLREMIARNEFREDLYYRLNGLVPKLLPLRDRMDIKAIVTKLLSAEANAGQYTIVPDIMELFKRHR